MAHGRVTAAPKVHKALRLETPSRIQAVNSGRHSLLVSDRSQRIRGVHNGSRVRSKLLPPIPCS